VLGRQQRVGDLLSVERWARTLLGVCAAALVAASAGCGDAGEAEEPIVAQPVAPPAVTTPEPTPVSADDLRPPESVVVEDEAAPTAGAARPGGVLSATDKASFRRLERSLGGRYGLALSGLGRNRRVTQVGTLRTGVAWSTSKLPIAMAVIAAGAGDTQREALTAAITLSDNAAADRLWQSLGGGQAAAQAADAQLREAGDATTAIEYRQLRSEFSPFGQTQWRVRDQAAFAAGMACVTAGAQVLGMMGQVDAGQRWGLGAAGVQAELKGGWGPGIDPGAGSGYFDRQLGVLTIDGKPMAAAIAAAPADGSHEAGTRDLTTIARWIVEHVDVSGLPSTPRCES
jgi:hypothetical protein